MFPANTPDRRTGRRQRVLKAAKITLGGAAVIDCTVRNLSDEGACLQVVSPVGIPEMFELLIGYGSIDKRYCQVMWRSRNQIGVTFG